MGIRILIVDDYAPWRDQLRSLLKKHPEWNIVGEACDGREAIAKATAMQPDLILLDVGMPSLNGFEAAKIIRDRCPAASILFVSQETDADVRDEAMRVGAVGYVLKSDAGAKLLDAISTAAVAMPKLSQ